jgi:hypothetical protein
VNQDFAGTVSSDDLESDVDAGSIMVELVLFGTCNS